MLGVYSLCLIQQHTRIRQGRMSVLLLFNMLLNWW